MPESIKNCFNISHAHRKLTQIAFRDLDEKKSVPFSICFTKQLVSYFREKWLFHLWWLCGRKLKPYL